MSNFIMVNCSHNMSLVAKSLESKGYSVDTIYTDGFSLKHCDNLWAVLDRQFNNLPAIKASVVADQHVSSINKPFMTFLTNRNLKEKLSNISKTVINGSFQDYIMLSTRLEKAVLTCEDKPSTRNIDSMLSDNPSSIVITSAYPSNAGKQQMTRWTTDCDIRAVFGDDVFVFFDGKNRYDMYSDKNDLITISDAKVTETTIKSINRSFERFTFEKQGSVTFATNQTQWVQRQTSRLYLLNDYSWYGKSAIMPDGWTKAVTKLLMADFKKLNEKGKKK